MKKLVAIVLLVTVMSVGFEYASFAISLSDYEIDVEEAGWGFYIPIESTWGLK